MLELRRRTYEIPIDIIRTRLVFHERSIDVDILDADSPEMIGHDREIVHQLQTAIPVPAPIRSGRTNDKERLPQLIECEVIVARWKKPSIGEIARHDHAARIPTTMTL